MEAQFLQRFDMESEHLPRMDKSIVGLFLYKGEINAEIQVDEAKVEWESG